MSKRLHQLSILLLFPIILNAATKEQIPVPVEAMNFTIPWIENKGQFPADEAFRLQSFAGPIVLEKTNCLRYSLLSESGKALHFMEYFQNSNAIQAAGIKQSPTQVNYFIGEKAFTNIPSFNVIQFEDLWPGIDVKLQATSKNIEKYFTIAPGTNPGDISMSIDNITDICIDENKELQLDIGEESIFFSRPIAWQTENDHRKNVSVDYWCNFEDGQASYGFLIRDYDTSRELTIDPLIASTYLGAGKSDQAVKVKVASDGKIYVCGTTTSVNFPTTPGAYDESYNDTDDDYDIIDVFVSRFSADLKMLEASTFIGGSNEDHVHGLDIDANGNVFIAGETESHNFPTTAGAYDNTHDADSDYDANIYISKFNADLSQLLASTFIGTEESSTATCMTINSQNQILISGSSGGDIPEVGPQFQRPCRGLYFLKINNTLSNILASNSVLPYLVLPHDIEIDANNHIFITGYMEYSLYDDGDEFPVTAGAYDTSYDGGHEIFVIKLDQNLTTNLACTYLGGSNQDEGRAIVFDDVGNVIIAGNTGSADYPVTPGAYDETLNTEYTWSFDMAISKLDNNLSTLIHSTFIGTTNEAEAMDMVIDGNNSVIVCGNASTGFPTLCNSYQNIISGYGAILVKMNHDLSKMETSTYLDGNDTSKGNSLCFDQAGNIVVCGSTEADDFPITPGAYDEEYNGDDKYVGDAFVSILTPDFIHNRPCCCWLNYPENGAMDVLPNLTVSWNESTNANGYYLSVGTQDDPIGIFNQMDVGNVLNYELNDLPCGEQIVITIDAYNDFGMAQSPDCQSTSFTTLDPYFEVFHDTICEGETLFWEGFPLYYEGRFRVIHQTIDGCDSTLQMNLTVLPAFHELDYGEICESESFTWFGEVYTETGNYFQIFTNTFGCDSIYELDLMVYPTYEIEQEAAICLGETYSWEEMTLTEAGEYSASYLTDEGCDSILYLSLQVHPVYESYDVQSICIGDSIEWEGQVIKTTGSYEAIYTTKEGCDSLLYLDVTVLPEYEFYEEMTICAGETYEWQGSTYSTEGNYEANYTSIDGCDSTYYLTLFVAPHYNFDETYNLCPDESLSWQGMVLDGPGDYSATYQSIYGCDSLYRITVTQTIIDTGVDQDGDVLIAMETEADSYQWIQCPDYQAIEGANQVDYHTSMSGSYAVIIEKEGCIDTSECLTLIHSGIFTENTVAIQVYPNPVIGNRVNVVVHGIQPGYNLRLIDLSGKTVLERYERTEQTTLSVQTIDPGIYFIQWKSEGKTITKKLIIL